MHPLRVTWALDGERRVGGAGTVNGGYERCTLWWLWHTPLMLLSLISTAQAGMPSFALTEVAELRLEAVSFFAVALLLLAFGLMQLWNRLTPLPSLSYGRALGLTVLLGLLFHLILTMISGARELMTPGAWEKRGATYVLAEQDDLSGLLDRQRELLQLQQALWDHAERHQGALPHHAFDPALPADAWTIEPYGLRYLYTPGLSPGVGAQLLAWEPEPLGPPRLGLYTDGRVVALPDPR